MAKNVVLSFGLLLLTLAVVACQPAQEPAAAAPEQPQAQMLSLPSSSRAPETSAHALMNSARRRIPLRETYDPSYFAISYPNGDVPNDRGVCTDVVIRAYREIGLDLQALVHEDMAENFGAYPKLWGLRSADKNIDHRRVPNLQRFFERQDAEVRVTANPRDYRPGDLVTWMLPGNLPHIGIVSDRQVAGGSRPLILHNIGHGTSEDDIFFTYRITRHYRFYPDGT